MPDREAAGYTAMSRDTSGTAHSLARTDPARAIEMLADAVLQLSRAIDELNKLVR